MVKGKKRIGELLIDAGVIDEFQKSAALGEQRQWGGRFGSVLIRMGIVDEESIVSILEKQLGQKCISLKDREISPKILSIIRPDIAKKYSIMPLHFDKRTLSIAISDTNDLGTIDDLSFMLGINIKPVFAIEHDIKNAIARYYG